MTPLNRHLTCVLRCLALGVAAALLLPVTPVAAAEAVLPTGEGLVLDGRGDEAAWKDALVLSADAIEVPRVGAAGTRTLTPRVRLLASEGRLWVHIEADEDPGAGIGVVMFVAQPGDESAADATAYAYRPYSMRTLRCTVRGPEGAGRAVYPFTGAADMQRAGVWSMELSVGLANLAPTDPTAALRVGLLLFTRTPTVTGAAPRGTMFTGPAVWQSLKPPAAGWNAPATFDAKRIAAEDAADAVRHKAWIEYLTINVELNKGKPRGGAEAQVVKDLEDMLFTPLEKMLAARPDLGPSINVIMADAYRQLGLREKANTHYDLALQMAPGWREARFGKAFHIELDNLISRSAGAASDFDAAFQRIAKRTQAGGTVDPYMADAYAIAHAVMQYKRGEFAEAAAALKPLAARYPSHRVVAMALLHAEKAVLPMAAEKSKHRRDAAAALPRAAILTTRGRVVVELFQNDAPAAVNNFVWLARKGFFDGMGWHHTVPFLMAQSGDPFSKPGADAARIGAGGPGYDIRAEESERLPVRGSLAMVRTGAGVVGSQFALLTGTGLHTKDTLVVFGRVLEGQSVVDQLTKDDRVTGVELLRVTEGWDYTPRNLAQQVPDEPKATATGLR